MTFFDSIASWKEIEHTIRNCDHFARIELVLIEYLLRWNPSDNISVNESYEPIAPTNELDVGRPGGAIVNFLKIQFGMYLEPLFENLVTLRSRMKGSQTPSID